MELKDKKVEELKKIAKKNKLVGYSKLNKNDLIKFIKKYTNKKTNNKVSKKVLTKKNKSKSKKMVGGLYIYKNQPTVYIPLEPNLTEEIPPGTFTIYTTGIKESNLRHIWTLILAPKLKNMIPDVWQAYKTNYFIDLPNNFEMRKQYKKDGYIKVEDMLKYLALWQSKGVGVGGEGDTLAPQLVRSTDDHATINQQSAAALPKNNS